MQASEPRFSVSLDKIPPLAELATLWQELESRAKPSFFLTWSWIGNWLASIEGHLPNGWLLSARRQGRLVGLGVVFDAPIRRRLLPMGRAAFVNETGIAEFDALCIEHNDFLLDDRWQMAIREAMFDRLCAAGSSWREVHMSRAAVGFGTPALLTRNLYRQRVTRDSCLVTLSKVRERGGDYVGMLRAGRRAHIRRCLRAYAAVGPLALTEALDVPTALAFLDRLIVLHDLRWIDRGGASQFSTPFCRAFHERLVRGALPRGEVQLLRVAAGTQELGYLYSFVHQGRVCFYQSGYDYGLLDPKYSPGLVTLVMAIQHNAAKGSAVFDFLAGNQAYKASLATDRTEMISWRLQRKSILATAELAMRWKLGLARRVWVGLCAAAARKGVRAVAGVLCLGALAAAGAAIGEAEIFDFLLGPGGRTRTA